MEVAFVASAVVPLIVAASRFDALRSAYCNLAQPRENEEIGFREDRTLDSILRKQSHDHALGERQSRGRGWPGLRGEAPVQSPLPHSLAASAPTPEAGVDMDNAQQLFQKISPRHAYVLDAYESRINEALA
ncbi:unnamed protein product [Urochloa humidicola]